MAKEILLYDDAYSWTASRVVSELNDARNASEAVLRFNGDGGELRYGWAMIGKAKEIKGKKVYKNDGEANSMYAFAFCYNDNNEAFDTSYFKFHRASYGLSYEQSEYCTDADKAELIEKNSKLREAMEAKIDVAEFTRITGVTMDQLFDMNDRIEVCLNANQAFECKLINRVVPITPEYQEQVRVLSAHFNKQPIAARSESIPTTMTKDEIKSKYPEAYKQIFAAGVKRGTTKENERVAPMFAYFGTNPVKVKAAFDSGKPMDEALKMECIQKSLTAQVVTTIEKENQPPITTAATEIKPGSPEEQKKKQAEASFNAAMDAEFQKMYPNSKKHAK